MKVTIQQIENGYLINVPFIVNTPGNHFDFEMALTGRSGAGIAEYRAFSFPTWEEAAVFLANYYRVQDEQRQKGLAQ
jgi:hypothetical protein